MNIRAWVGGEGEQEGQGCSWESFPTLHCATTENERLFLGSERGGAGEGTAGRVSSGTPGTTPAPCCSFPGLINSQGCALLLFPSCARAGLCSDPPCAQTGHPPGLGKHWHWERLEWFIWIQTVLGKQSNECCLLWEFLHGLILSVGNL